MYLSDADGKKSMTVTMSVIAFIVVLVKFLFSGASVSFMGFDYSFGSVGSDDILAMLSPILGTYAFRRYTMARYPDYSSDSQGWNQQQGYEESSTEYYPIDSGSKPSDGRNP